jgi:hypothetical protein
MPEQIETVRHYSTLDEAERARQYLEDNDLRPIVSDESHRRDASDGVYALQLPESQLDAAETLLDELEPSEEEAAVETLEDWEDESEEIREKFEQD